MLAENLAQTPAGTVADNGVPDPFGGNEAGLRLRIRLHVSQKADCKRIAAHSFSVRSDTPEFRIPRQPPRLREAQMLLHIDNLLSLWVVSYRASAALAVLEIGNRSRYLAKSG